MKNFLKQRHWLNSLRSITLSVASIFLVTDISSASPLCYMIDANGKQINLSFLCSNAKTSTPLPPKTTPSATTTPTNPQTPITPPANAITPPTPQPDTSSAKKPEVDKSKLPAIQRAIPLLQNQKTPQINN
jgi:hypothetical protein